MEFVTIPSPGTSEGPCRGSCSHPKCHALRALAEDHCAQCGRALGFVARITGDPPVHARCVAASAHDGIQGHDHGGHNHNHGHHGHGH